MITDKAQMMMDLVKEVNGTVEIFEETETDVAFLVGPFMFLVTEDDLCGIGIESATEVRTIYMGPAMTAEVASVLAFAARMTVNE